MAVVKNTFTKTLSSITSASYTITGLTSATSTTSMSYMSKELTTQFMTSIYQSLLDAGYSDAAMNTSDYSLSVLGFKFFVLMRTYNGSNLQSTPLVYTHGNSTYIGSTSENDTYYINTTDYYNLSYKIIIRGSSDCVGIWYSSYKYPNSEIPLIFIAKAKNLITGGDGYCFCNRWYNNNSSYKVYFRNKNDLYTVVSDVCINYSHYMMPYPAYIGTGLNTASKFVCEPVLGNYGTYLIKSVIKSNEKIFTSGSYYQIGTDKYFNYGYKEGTSTAYSGAFLLMKVS